MNIDEVKQGYEKVIHASQEAVEAGKLLAHTKTDISAKVLLATAKGEIVGKNEKERNAVAYKMFKPEYEVLSELEAEYKKLSHNLQIAQLRLQCLRDCIRVEELAKP